MKLSEVCQMIEAEVLCGDRQMLESEITSACGSDLMSDVMAFVKENVLLITGLVNPQVIRTAEMMDIHAILFVRGKPVAESVLTLAREKNMIILRTRQPMFVTCGILYQAGITERGVWDACL